jgi:hypothetical protein
LFLIVLIPLSDSGKQDRKEFITSGDNLIMRRRRKELRKKTPNLDTLSINTCKVGGLYFGSGINPYGSVSNQPDQTEKELPEEYKDKLRK